MPGRWPRDGRILRRSGVAVQLPLARRLPLRGALWGGGFCVAARRRPRLRLHRTDARGARRARPLAPRASGLSLRSPIGDAVCPGRADVSASAVKNVASLPHRRLGSDGKAMTQSPTHGRRAGRSGGTALHPSASPGRGCLREHGRLVAERSPREAACASRLAAGRGVAPADEGRSRCGARAAGRHNRRMPLVGVLPG